MTQILPTQTLLERAPVVIIGGGVIGDSIARHLGRLGLRDVVVLERDKLTSGHFMARSGADRFGGDVVGHADPDRAAQPLTSH